MDVFNNDATPNTPSDTPIGLETLVGETQKYKSPDELAKAYVNAEGFIETLKAEKTQVASELNSLKAKLEVYERLAATKLNDPTPATPDPVAAAPKVNSEPKVDNLEDRIRSTLEAERAKERKLANRNVVNDKLTELFGDKARDVITAKAQELGVGIDWLTTIAETSPNAFFNTLGLGEKGNAGSTPTFKNDVNPAAMANAGKVAPNSYAYFAQMRKTDPRRYFSAEVQKQVFAAAQSNPNFYKE